MPKRISNDTIKQIRQLRRQGWSLPEIHKKVGIGYGSVYRYIQGVSILSKYTNELQGKRGGSIKRMRQAEHHAENNAKRLIQTIGKKEWILFFSALYWGEGNKTDFSVINSDPRMVRFIIDCLYKVFEIDPDRIRLSVRIYQGMNQETEIAYWSGYTGVSRRYFCNTEIVRGKKAGSLPHGLCRVRVKKGGNLLKYVKAVYVRAAEMRLSP